MSRPLTAATTLDNLKKEAKRWLKALRADDEQARARFGRAHPEAPAQPGLREVQHAIALEHGLPSWAALKEKLADDVGNATLEAAVTALLDAANRGDASRVTDLLDMHPDIINERGLLSGHSGLRTALHFAINSCDEAVVTCLLERGADPNIRCEGDNAAPLHFAAEKEHLGIIRLLIEHGADPIGAGDYHELEVIGWATCFGTGRKDLVDYLLAHGAAHNIFSAVAMGDVEIIRKLAAGSRADLDRRMDQTNKRRRPLHLAVVKKQPQSIATLLELSADAEALDEAGLTALDQAALDGEIEMAQLLIDRGATPQLPAAIGLQRTHDIERLVREDPDCLKPGRRWGTLIVRASEHAPGHVIDELIRLGASVDVRDDPRTAVDGTAGYTPLHAAAFHGNADAAAVLLQHGANPSVREEKYCGTPAGWAAYAGHTAVRDLILEGPIDLFDAIDFDLTDRIPGILARDPDALNRPFGQYVIGQPRADHWWPDPECTPLAWAVVKKREHIADALRKRGTLVESFLTNAGLDWRVGGSERIAAGHTAGRLLRKHPDIARDSIYTAVVCGDLGEVERVLAERPEAVSEKGGPREWPPLLYLCSTRLALPAANDNAVAIARTLLDRGADPNAYYPGGSPGIHYTALTCVIGEGEENASRHPQFEALTLLLLERGAEPYDMQVLYNTHFRGDMLWLLEQMYAKAVELGRQADWDDPNWSMLDMGGYGCGARYLLGIAVDKNDLRLAEWILTHGATPNAAPPPGRNQPKRGLHEEALRRGHTAMADLLVRYGATPSVLVLEGVEAFAAACFRLDRKEAQALLAQHPEYIRSPVAMFAAARRDRADIVALLLDLGMSVDLENDHGTRALHEAAYSDAPRVVALLIERGAEIDPVESNHGNTPLGWAVYGRKPRTIELLGRVSRDVFTITWTGNVERLRELLRAEPDLAKIVGDEHTPLMWLPDDEGHAMEIATLLLARGADPSIRNKSGLTAEDLARRRGLDEVAELLRSKAR